MAAYIENLSQDSELSSSILEVAKRKGIKSGVFSLVGAVKCARIGYYNQLEHKYTTIKLDEPHEIVSCIGNISLKEGEPFVHAHIAFANSRGEMHGGHLVDATVFAAELYIEELGTELLREYDSSTGLWLLHHRI